MQTERCMSYYLSFKCQSHIQSSAVIMPPNTVIYYTCNYRNWTGRRTPHPHPHPTPTPTHPHTPPPPHTHTPHTPHTHTHPLPPPLLALTGELWGVFGEHLWENWPRYNSPARYIPDTNWAITVPTYIQANGLGNQHAQCRIKRWIYIIPDLLFYYHRDFYSPFDKLMESFKMPAKISRSDIACW